MTTTGYLVYGAFALLLLAVVVLLWAVEGRAAENGRHLARLVAQGEQPDDEAEPVFTEPPPLIRKPGGFIEIDGVRHYEDAPTGGLRVGDPYPIPVLGIDDDPCIAIRHGQMCIRVDEHEGPHVAVEDVIVGGYAYITALWDAPTAQLDDPPLSLVKAPLRPRGDDTGEHDFRDARLAPVDAKRGVSS